MNVRQISVFLENAAGRLADACDLLGKNGINMRALSLADASDFGVLRMIVNDTDAALRLLKEHAYAAAATEVIAVEVPDTPGGLASILRLLRGEGVNIEYMYAFVEKKAAAAVVVIRVEAVDRAAGALGAANVRMLTEADVAML
ncbi:ACT domain-containing protein [bacterium]|nr:ACT domain-containing protein [bacterium]